MSQLVLFESGLTDPHAPDIIEVANYVTAVEHGLRRLKTLPVCLRLVCELHGILLEGARGREMKPGEFRDRQNYIGTSTNIGDAIFVPPAPAEMQMALNDFEKYLHAPPLLPPLVRLALIHYQFEAIHPFMDGNGRIGRLLLTLLLCAENLLAQPLLYLSAYFERNRREYYRLLLAVSQEGVWQEWIGFFLKGVVEQSKDAIRRSQALLDLWDAYRRNLQSARSPGLALRLLDNLFSLPVVSVPGAAKFLGVTQRTAQLNVGRLVAAGILKEVTGRRRGRLYIAREVVRTIEAD